MVMEEQSAVSKIVGCGEKRGRWEDKRMVKKPKDQIICSICGETKGSEINGFFTAFKAKVKGQTEDKRITLEINIAQDNASPLVVFAHGAGAPSSSDWMIRSLFSPFFLHMSGEKGKSPPRQKLTLETHKCKCPKSFRVKSHLN
ncbi:hypothetical protein CXB51_013948 [Gossypium anomalum]|uniref:Uncharacterized protein n=1 Tax=Gossypium anomalum TaxID=47600 RepID=A0A8J6D0V3_9ROSI|nr:hypothetical protein CXB51_013948 [Gossypium anomalum]